MAQELLGVRLEIVQAAAFLEHGNGVSGVVLSANVLVFRRVAEHEVLHIARAAVKPPCERADSREVGAGEGAAGQRATRSVETPRLEGSRVWALVGAHPLAGVRVAGGGRTAAANAN